MKKVFYLFLLNVFSLNLLLAQEFVSTEPQLRNVVLEEFTGIHCGNCPGGHKTAKQLADENPGRVLLVSIHEGSYAIPGKNEPDFRTKWGASILNQTGLTAFPAATINRLKFPGEPYSYPYNPQTKGGMAMNVNGWKPAAEDSVLNSIISPMNIDIKTNWNNDTRDLEIKVEVYFTETISDGAKLNIYLLENHIWGPQTGASDPLNYEHNHVLRDLLTGQWGEIISSTEKGDLFSKTYNVKIDSKFVITNCDLAVFITKSSNKEIYTGIQHSIIEPNISFSIDKVKLNEVRANTMKQFNCKITNKTNSERTLKFAIEKSSRTPFDWSAEFSNSFSEITLAANEEKELQLKTTVGKQKGIGDFDITISELNNPVSKQLFEKVTLVSNDILYLEIDCGGVNISDIANYNSDFVSFPNETFLQVKDILKELNLVVWNFGARGRLEKENADILNNQYLSGIGILMNGSGALPTLVNENPKNEFFDLFGITWSPANQIEIMNFGLKGVPNDPVTNDFFASNLSVANNGYLMQTTTISNPSIAYPMLKMTENENIISARIVKNNTRAIYLGFNLSVLTELSQRQKLLIDCLNWIENINSVKDEIFLGKSFQIVQKSENFQLINITNKAMTNVSLSMYNYIGIEILREKIDYIDKHQYYVMNVPSSLYSSAYYVLIYNNDIYEHYPLSIIK